MRPRRITAAMARITNELMIWHSAQQAVADYKARKIDFDPDVVLKNDPDSGYDWLATQMIKVRL